MAKVANMEGLVVLVLPQMYSLVTTPTTTPLED